MSAVTNLKRRGAVYYARQVVPADLQQAFGRRERQKSLDTRDLRVAKVELPLVLSAWQREFEQLRRRREVTEEDFAAATWDHYSDELARDQQERSWPIDAGTREYLALNRPIYLAALRDHLGRGETVLIVAPDVAPDRLLDRVEHARRVGATVLSVDGGDPQLDGLVHERMSVTPTDMLAPQGVEFSFDLAQHLVSTAAGARTPNGRYGALRAALSRA